jgi:hypothetical protein
MAVQFNLIPHPAAPPSNPSFKVWVDVQHASMLGSVASTQLWFCVGAPMIRFVLPEPREPERADDLWQATCFEVFLRNGAEEAYREWNFAPSGQWAAYDFAAYREGREDARVDQPPYIRLQDNLTWWQLGATLAVESGDKQLGLSCILEEKDGTRSYWALAHGTEEPDFHDPGCFAARLA